MDKIDFTVLENYLGNGKVKIEFIKLDGTYRVMMCTKNPGIITESKMPQSSNDAKENTEILKVFDLEKNAWRSMRKDRIRQWESYT